MITPRQYLSFSQLAKFEMSPEKYAEEYIYGQKGRTSRNMAYGSQMADGLENGEASGDPLLDLMMARLPKFDRMDMPVVIPGSEGMSGFHGVMRPGTHTAIGTRVTFERHGKKQDLYVPVLKDGKEKIPLLAVPDTSKPDYSAFKEYKTSVRKWTQKMADDSGQITFYATAIWLATGKIPNDIELVNVQTAYQEDGSLTVTGEMFRYQTHRHMSDIIKMTLRMRKAWAGIKQLCESELL